MLQVKEEPKDCSEPESENVLDATGIKDDEKQLFTILYTVPEDQIKDEMCQVKRETEEINQMELEEEPLTEDVSIDENPDVKPLLEDSIADTEITYRITEQRITAENTEVIKEINSANEEPSIHFSTIRTEISNFQFENVKILSKRNNSSFLPTICTKTVCDVSKQKLGQNSDSEENLVHCKVCGLSFSSKGGHMHTHTVKSPNCAICSKSFSRSCDLKIHMSMHTDQRRFTCTLCSKSFTRGYNLKQHIRKHKGELPFTCDLCSKSFFQRSYLEEHMRTHTGERPFTCTICSKSFSQSTHLKLHMRTHTGERPFTCDLCNKSFIQRSQLVAHIRTHTGERAFTCTLCSKSFSHHCSFKRHMRIHTDQRPFRCTLCSKSFSRSSDLKRHIRTHTGERPFTCTLCSKCFSQSTHLKLHMRIHTDQRPFTCALCNKSFSRSSHLKTHMSTHTDERPFA